MIKTDVPFAEAVRCLAHHAVSHAARELHRAGCRGEAARYRAIGMSDDELAVRTILRETLYSLPQGSALRAVRELSVRLRLAWLTVERGARK